MKIEPLRREHLRDAFDCGEPSLNRFICQQARQFEERRIGRTFVAVEDDSLVVIGFYTLVSSNLAFMSMPDNTKLPPNMPIPTILLGRLAVGKIYQSRGSGKILLIHALLRSMEISKQIGVYAVEVDALNEDARRFYLKYGFTPLHDDIRHLYLAIKKSNRNFSLWGFEARGW